MKTERWWKFFLPTTILFASATFANAQQIAFTWDDLPAHSTLPADTTRVEIGRKLIAAMKAEHLPPVYGFVNGGFGEHEPAAMPMLKDWRDAGFLLGNHTWSHMNLNSSSLAAWEGDLLKNEPTIEPLMKGADWHWLRYPNLAEGNTPEKRDGARKFLREHGYKVAAVTMSFADYAYNDPYARCLAKGDADAVAQLKKAYLDAADSTADQTRAMAKALYGHDIPYVLLMHVGALDAELLPQLLKLYRSKGYAFVSLEQAEKDPFYANDLDLSLPGEPDTLPAALRAKGIDIPAGTRPTVNLNAICR